MPCRVDPESVAVHTDDEMEMGDLVIDVKPEPHPWPLQAAGLQQRSPKESQSAPWTSLVPHPHDHQPWTDKHPDTLTCGFCLQTFPVEATTAFMDHKTQGCPPSRGPSPGPDSELENLKALTCLRCGRQFTEAWRLLRHAQWDHGLTIYQSQFEAPETPLLLGLAEVAAARPAVAGQEVEAEGSRANSRPRRSPICPVCMKALSTFGSLKVHMRSHTAERPYACDQCSFACAHSSSLTTAAHTPGSGPIPVTSAPLPVSRGANLAATAAYTVWGPHCRVPFCLRATLDRHLWQRHPQAGGEA